VKVDSRERDFSSNGKRGDRVSPAGIDVTLDVEPYWGKLKNQAKTNSSAMKLDVFIHPQIKAQFGNHYDMIESQFNIAPLAETTPWRGMAVSAQWIIPVQNELGVEGNHGRPGFLTVNQTLRLPANAFISGTAGYFSEHRYGLDFEIKKFLKNGRWAIDAGVGYTGFAMYSERVWYYSGIADWTYFLSGEFRCAKTNFTTKATFGKFLFGDNGFRFDVLRQFGEVDIGFFMIQTEDGSNGGFDFSIPLYPSKRFTPKRIRISPAHDFQWSYWYRGTSPCGIQYTTHNSVDGYMKNLNPDFVKNQLTRDSINP